MLKEIDQQCLQSSNIYNGSKFIYKYFYDCVVVYVYVTLDTYRIAKV